MQRLAELTVALDALHEQVEDLQTMRLCDDLEAIGKTGQGERGGIVQYALNYIRKEDFRLRKGCIHRLG